MTLNEFAAGMRRTIFDDLRAGREPSQGSFDDSTLRAGRVKGAPQVGTTRYEPNAIHMEFIFPDPTSSATILTVTVTPPERVVFLPVPEWVIESIWQGDVDGSYHFESDAKRLLEALAKDTEPDANLKWFGPRQAKRRE